jgi:hypothetical protein
MGRKSVTRYNPSRIDSVFGHWKVGSGWCVVV